MGAQPFFHYTPRGWGLGIHVRFYSWVQELQLQIGPYSMGLEHYSNIASDFEEFDQREYEETVLKEAMRIRSRRIRNGTDRAERTDRAV